MRIAAFGEYMLRLKSPGYTRLLQENRLEATFGGAEANVAMCLAAWGLPSRYITLLPENDLGQAALRSLLACGVDTSCIPRLPGRLGVYFVEAGAGDRPSRVIYDRADSCIARVRPGDIDWDAALEGVDILHLTGITPGISQAGADETLNAAHNARRRGILVSLDLNYRAKLFQFGKTPQELLLPLAREADILIANEAQFAPCLGYTELPQPPEEGEPDPEFYQDYCDAVMNLLPQVRLLAVTRRRSLSINRGTWAACIMDRDLGSFAMSRCYHLEDMVDRVGSGDAFTSGILYAHSRGWEPAQAVEFAMASGVLKHTVPGDFNAVTVPEIQAFLNSRGQANVIR